MADARSSELVADTAATFRQAVEHIGGQSATSRLIGLSQQAISDRLAKGQPCPTANGAVLKIEGRTGISRHDLRPDIYGPPPTLVGDPSAYERAQ